MDAVTWNRIYYFFYFPAQAEDDHVRKLQECFDSESILLQFDECVTRHPNVFDGHASSKLRSALSRCPDLPPKQILSPIASPTTSPLASPPDSPKTVRASASVGIGAANAATGTTVSPRRIVPAHARPSAPGSSPLPLAEDLSMAASPEPRPVRFWLCFFFFFFLIVFLSRVVGFQNKFQ
jgi:hypothetical protein